MSKDKDIDAVYEELKKKGQNNVENLVQWLKDAKVLETVKKTEDEARKMFDDVKDKEHVTVEKFKAVLKSMSESANQALDGLFKTLTESMPKLLDAFQEAAAVFKEKLSENAQPNTSKK